MIDAAALELWGIRPGLEFTFNVSLLQNRVNCMVHADHHNKFTYPHKTAQL